MEKPGKITYTLSTLSMLNQFHPEGKYCDVQLRVGTKLFKCQRSLLAAASEYFDTMFSSDFQESNATIDEPIPLLGMDAIAFEKMLRFMYTGDISINDSNVLQMLFMNDFLRLRTTHVKEECIKHLKSRSQEREPISNAFELLSFAYTNKAENKLVDTLSAHICQHLHYYSKDAQLLKVDFDKLNALLKFSKNYILSLSGSQNVVLKIVHSWIDHDREGRAQYRCELMKNINFSNVSSDFTLLLINKLEKRADDLVNVSRDIKPHLEPETLGMEMLAVDGDSRFEATVTLYVKDLISEMENSKTVFSLPTIICNLSWKVGVKRSKNDYLGVYLHCGDTSKASTWQCCAKSTFTLVSRKRDQKNFIRESDRYIFSSNNQDTGFGLTKFMDWDYLNDPENGYIEDNSLLLRTHVYADVPFCPNQ